MQRARVVGMVVLVCAFTSSFASGMDGVYALLVVSPKVSGFKEDEKTFEKLLNRLGDCKKKVVVIQQEGRGDKQRILNAIGAMGAGPGDTVFFYYSGHGAVDKFTREYVFTLDGRERLGRSEVLSALQRHGCRLTVLLSDCCAVTMPFSEEPEAVAMSIERVVFNMKHLMMDFAGVADIQSSTVPEISWGTEEGGVFTQSFNKAICRSTFRGNNGWADLFRDVHGRTGRLYDRMKKDLLNDAATAPGDREYLRQQSDQTPIAFSLPRTSEKVGLRVTDVYPNTAATRLLCDGRRISLRKNDIVTSLSGNALKTVSDYIDAIDMAGRHSTLPIRFQRGSTEYSGTIQLDSGGSYRFGARLQEMR